MSSILKGPHNPRFIDNIMLIEFSYSEIKSIGERIRNQVMEICTGCQFNRIEVFSVSVHDSSSKLLVTDIAATKPMITPIKIDISNRQQQRIRTKL